MPLEGDPQPDLLYAVYAAKFLNDPGGGKGHVW